MRKRGPNRQGLAAVGVLAMAGTTILFACASSDEGGEQPVVENRDASVADASHEDSAPAKPDARTDADANMDDGEFEIPDASVVCETATCAKSIRAAGDGFCVVLDSGKVSCWGANESGRLGQDPMTEVITTPTVIEGLTDVKELSVAAGNTCARVADGRVYCLGESDLVYPGQTATVDAGELPWQQFSTPVLEDAVPPGENLTVGSSFACMKASDGSLTCWGANARLELGRGPSETDLPAPPGKASLLTETVASVFAGDGRTFVVNPGGDVFSWGTNKRFGRGNLLLGRDTSEDPNGEPTRVPLLSRVRGIATGVSHACAISARHIDCWGGNSLGQLGLGTFDANDYLPTRNLLDWVTDTEDADAGPDAASNQHDVPVQVVVGRQHSCAVLGSGRVYCWGNSGPGRQLGTAFKADAIHGTPTRIDGFSGPAVALAAGDNATCALLRSGAVECWGANDRGQLGSGTTDVAAHPTPVRVSISE